MTSSEPQVTAVGEHRYVITLRQGDEVVRVALHADQDTVALVASDDLDERLLVERTVAFLLARQRADELPPALDLADVAAGYGSWAEAMRGRSNAAGDERPGERGP